MKFACESCQAQYMISDDKVGPRGVKVRCKKCNHVNVVRRPAPATDPDLAAPAPAPAKKAGNLEDEIGAAFDNVVGGAPVPAAGTAPARAAGQDEQDDPFASGDFDTSGDVPDHERTQFIPAADLQRAFASHEPEPAPAPAAAAALEWYVAIDDEQVGPLPFDEVRARWEKAEIGPDTLCWRTGMADWAPLAQVPELADALAPLKTAAASTGDQSWLQAAMTPQETPAAAPGWKPSAASALASLVEAELEASKKAEVPPEATLEQDLAKGGESTGIRTLLKNLPEADGPAPEMSRLLPLGATPDAAPAPAAEPVRTAPAPAPAAAAPVAAAPAEKKGGAGKWIAAAAAAVVLVAGGAFAGGLFGKSEAPAPAPVAAAPVPAPAAAPPPAPAPVAEAPAAAAGGAEAPAAGQGGAAGAAVAAAGTQADPVEETARKVADDAESRAKALAAAPPEDEKEEPVVAAAKTTRKKATPRPARTTRRTEPAPAPAPAPSSGDLLDAAGNTNSIDSLFASEFRKPAPKPASGGGSTYIPPAPGGGGKPHQLSQGDIAGVVVGHKGALKTCATNYKSKSGLDSGTVVMRWTIRPNGSTTGVQPVKGAEHKELASCIGGLVKGWKFPAYSGPQMAPIDFPFQF